MTDRAEIERLLNQTGRTLEGLPKEYPGDKCRAVGRVRGLTPAVAGNSILHQSDVIELLVGALRDALDKPMQKPLAEMNRILLEEAGKLMPEWISVKDKLPPRELKVLAVDGHGCIRMLALWKKGGERWTWIENSRFTHRNDITHWMPLPSKPEE